MKKFTAYMLLLAFVVFIIALVFSYDTNLQNALYTLIGLDWIIFTPIAAYYLLK